jgi:hypothetical protein
MNEGTPLGVKSTISQYGCSAVNGPHSGTLPLLLQHNLLVFLHSRVRIILDVCSAFGVPNRHFLSLCVTCNETVQVKGNECESLLINDAVSIGA